ncbi:MAG: RNA polymerase sigma factor [Alphaproteobacteria bacterium]|nr:RNA polymerase sigma factor [Alphaproteobacteria bacterium]
MALSQKGWGLPMTGNHSELRGQDLWRELAVKAQQGDQRAYAALLRDIVPFIRAVASGSLANPDWVDDLVQDVLVSVHKSLSTYSDDRPFKPWLSAIIQFRRTDLLRKYYKNRSNKTVGLDDLEFSAQHVTNPAFAGELKDIEAALADLPDNQRKVFEMIKIHGYSAQEVANEMGMSVSAVKVSAHRTMNKLKDRLG